MRQSKTTILFLLITMLASFFTACSGQEINEKATTQALTTVNSHSAEPAPIAKFVERAYPLDENERIFDKTESEISPVYYALSRVTDQGMQDDYVYIMPDGDMNPAPDVPLLFIDGVFTAKGTGLLADGIIEPGRPYVPIGLISETFGGTADWDEASRSMIVKIFDHEIQLSIDSNLAKFDSENVTLLNAPIFENGEVYVAADDDLSRYYSLTVSYMPDFEFPAFANNPIIAIDKLDTDLYMRTVNVTEIKEYARERLRAGLENAKRCCVGTAYESQMLKAAVDIGDKIDNLSIYGGVSRYLMMEGPYQMLVDVYTKDIYFYISAHGICYVVKADINDPDLFFPVYLGNY